MLEIEILTWVLVGMALSAVRLIRPISYSTIVLAAMAGLAAGIGGMLSYGLGLANLWKVGEYSVVSLIFATAAAAGTIAFLYRLARDAGEVRGS